MTYISLFSSSGVGCYGFKQENFECIATVEIIERRLNVQRYNHKCLYESGYICGDMSKETTKQRVIEEVEKWKKNFRITDLDVLIATPPCQGMSVVNHKKKDELNRNSLVIESIKMIQQLKPKFFIFENVKTFLNSICTDVDGTNKKIKDAIEADLSSQYNICFKILNFKEYGCPSSRTRTLIIGVRKDLINITPYNFYPQKQGEKTLRQVIGHLPSLKNMGEISDTDIYHNFKPYSKNMEEWIKDLKEGESAFDNSDPMKRPHSMKNGKIIFNVRKNGDKYTRQYWDKIAPCIHTRNDIMASQNTVHPTDNRVFSIRELMLMMSIPDSFRWSDIPFEKLNNLTFDLKTKYLKKVETNIRQSIGEAVPTIIFRQIATNIKNYLNAKEYSLQDINTIIKQENLTDKNNLLNFIRTNTYIDLQTLVRISEIANTQRESNSAYYTRQDICYCIIKHLPEAKNYDTLNILEPSVGVGNFIYVLFNKYSSVKSVNIDIVDIDSFSIDILKELLKKIQIPNNFTINYINADFLLYNFTKHYDIVIGNPPYKKIVGNPKLLGQYKLPVINKDTNNIFSFFVEKSLILGDIVSLIVPKSLINVPEFDKTRNLINQNKIDVIIDFGEKGFKGVKIETICFIADTKHSADETIIESYITEDIRKIKQSYFTDNNYPYWLIYRNQKFDNIAKKIKFNVFTSYRDRKISKSITGNTGKYRVLKSRNIGNNTIVNIPNYDSYINTLYGLDVAKYLNYKNCVLVPNLTYYPRACFLPQNCITDGSVAILTLKDKNTKIDENDLSYFSTEEFTYFYKIARNRGTRSLNIDNNSVFFFGLLKR